MAAFYVKNLPGWERAVRVIAGLGAAGWAIHGLPHPMGWIAAVSAVGVAASGLLGFCPLCALAGRGRPGAKG